MIVYKIYELINKYNDFDSNYNYLDNISKLKQYDKNVKKKINYKTKNFNIVNLYNRDDLDNKLYRV